jgi:hypothetical protein
MLAVELQEGAQRMAQKPHHDEMSNAASIVARLCEAGDFCGSRRVVYGDSFFASYDMCNELMHKGLYFKGIVKQCSGGYPKEFIRDWWHLGIETAKSNELFRQDCVARRWAIKTDTQLTKNRKVNGATVKGTRTLAYEQLTAEIDALKKSQNPTNTSHKNIKRHASIPRGQHICLLSSLDVPTNVGNPHPPIIVTLWLLVGPTKPSKILSAPVGTHCPAHRMSELLTRLLLAKWTAVERSPNGQHSLHDRSVWWICSSTSVESMFTIICGRAFSIWKSHGAPTPGRRAHLPR